MKILKDRIVISINLGLFISSCRGIEAHSLFSSTSARNSQREKKMKKIFSLFLLCLFFAFVLLSNAIESPQFTVVHSESDFEIRLYRESSWMSAPVQEISFEKATKQGFHRLYQYIHGDNLDSSELKMTAPVLTSITSEAHKSEYYVRLFQYIQGANLNSSRIRMTAPVLTSIVPEAGPLHSSAYFVRFYLPVKFQASPPLPLPELNLHPDAWASHCIAVRKFSGFARDSNIIEEAEKLALSLSRSKWGNSTSSDRRYAYSIAQYNSPFRFVGRVNEVWVDIDGAKTEDCPASGVAAAY